LAKKHLYRLEKRKKNCKKPFFLGKKRGFKKVIYKNEGKALKQVGKINKLKSYELLKT
jgi:hypothetical protein